jgi:hypothetical protein
MKVLTGKIVSATLRMARGTATMVGLVVMIALVLGIGTTALAAVPGDPFKLGRINTIGRITQLVGSTNNAMLRIENSSKGPDATALDLQVAPGKPPVRINSRVRVANLNADRLDGKDAATFARADTPTYVSINAASTGPPPFDPFASNRAFCDDGDRLLTGGYFDLSNNGVAVESFGDLDGWHVTVKRTDNSSARISIRAVCLDFPPLRE